MELRPVVNSAHILLGLLLTLSAKVGAITNLLTKPFIPGGNNYVVEGEHVTITCHHDTTGVPVTSTLTMEMTGDRNITLATNGTNVVTDKSWVEARSMYYQLVIANVTFDDAGTYRCFGDPTKREEYFDLDLKVFRVDTIDALVSEKTTTAELICNVTNSPSNANYGQETAGETKWFRKRLSSGDSDQLQASEGKWKLSRDSLEVKSVVYYKYDDVGEYQCQIQPADGAREMNFTVSINVAAKVERFRVESTKGFQGKEKRVFFNVSGFPLPEMIWTMDGSPLTLDNRTQIVASEGSLINNTIVFLTLEYKDRGKYACAVSNPHGEDSKSIFVRVKDPLGALWPFLGILAQLAVLFLIIFFYGKRKSADDDESTTATASRDNAVFNQGNENLRKRTVSSQGGAQGTQRTSTV